MIEEEQADALIKNEKKLAELTRVQNPLDPIASVVAVALKKIMDRLMGKKPPKELLSQIKNYWMPIANNFGMWKTRYPLEDRWFALTDPHNYNLVVSVLKKREKLHQRVFQNITAIVSQQLRKRGVTDFQVIFRKKNVYGIYAKMKRKHQNINHITDLFAVRILVGTASECYEVLEVLDYLWPSFRHRFKDYIQHPKANGYQSIHTVLCCLEKKPVEFQIRTTMMDWIAKYGPASHAHYKLSPEES